ncbi:unnamed protein product [Caenorhabditis sp. 36 PRJEB53466]|nr:unnamed protein product [Caenorhabditis sp. 36 PRJEB53466]
MCVPLPGLESSNLAPADIRRGAQHLLREITDFIEHKAELGRPVVKLPLFYVAGFNFLKQHAEKTGIRDPVLDFLPNAVEMVLFTECGPPPPGTLPILDARRMLVEPAASETSLLADVARFLGDILEYCRNAVQINGGRTMPPLPYAYLMTLVWFQETYRDDPSTQNLRLVASIPRLMQEYLRRALGDLVPPAYVDIAANGSK